MPSELLAHAEAGLYSPLAISTLCLASDNLDFLRAAVFLCRIPFTTALSISWYASVSSF